MAPREPLDRRGFLAHTVKAGLVVSAAELGAAAPAARRAIGDEPAASLVARISDPEIRAGVDAAITRTLDPAAVERVYPGHFTVTADGRAYGSDTTYPGLDSWQMAGAYLLLGRTRIALDYFDFVEASQRRDGHVPFLIMPGGAPIDTSTCLRGLKYPDDVYTFKPKPRGGRKPQSNLAVQKWIGLFRHWQLKADPLSTLAPVSHILTAAEIHAHVPDPAWLLAKLPSIEAAARFLLSKKTAGGLISGSGFYTEMPPRYDRDGVAQCYVAHAFARLADLFRAVGDNASRTRWAAESTAVRAAFVRVFWKNDHFAEYVHPERGVVDAHGLSDVNWAAVAFGLADDTHLKTLWPRLKEEKAFWQGDMPTQTVTRPFSYAPWEYHEPLPFVPGNGPVYDVAAMGRVWYLEILACQRLGDRQRLATAARLVCRAAKTTDGHWHERYHPLPDGGVKPAGPRGYCEYAAVLVRAVLGNPGWFSNNPPANTPPRQPGTT
jgi:hypothetical protein